MEKNKIIGGVVCVLCALIMGIMGFFLGLSLRGSSTQSTNANLAINTTVVPPANTNLAVNTHAEVPTDTLTDSFFAEVTPVVDAGVTWLDEPEALDDLKLFNNENEDLGDVAYSKVANLSTGGSLVYAEVNYNSPSQPGVARFIQLNGHYTLVNNHSDQGLDELVAKGVDLDYLTKYSALSAPDRLSVGGSNLETTVNFGWYNTLFNELDPELIGDLHQFGATAYGGVYVSQSDVPDYAIQNKRFILRLADGSIVLYQNQKDFLADDGSIVASFQKNYSDFSARTFTNGLMSNGCGFPSGDSVGELTREQLTQIGATASEDPLYTVTDANSRVLQNAYTTYGVGRDYEGSENPPMPYEAFVSQHPLLVWQDPTGDYLLFMDTEYQALAECGKPVVYLYPTTPTQVSVQVGANITVSDPVYAAGWKVLAQPSGQLTTADGRTYGSLYWEGKGYGSYPAITHGRVVSRGNIELELRHDLTAQGLNEQETQDFLDFWLPKMPNTPYVRLTWLGTRAMNQLAPLTISPTPDTTIRVFLDFAGQATPNTNLAPQTLSALPRTGFTLVEWGGLLLGQ